MTAVPSTRYSFVTRPIVRAVTPLAEVPAQLGTLQHSPSTPSPEFGTSQPPIDDRRFYSYRSLPGDEALYWSAGVPRSCL